jgi:hypothetical protein
MKTMRIVAIACAVAGGSAYADGSKNQQQTEKERSIQSVHFAFDSDTPLDEDLLPIANLLACSPNETVILDGYTDPVGSEAYNADLAKRRAMAVRDKLVAHGIDKDRILLGVFGEGGMDKDSNALERRVDVHTSALPVAELIEARKGTAVSIVKPDGEVEQGQNQPDDDQAVRDTDTEDATMPDEG